MPACVVLLATLQALVATAKAEHWIETSQQDFADGRLSDNLYVSHRDDGTIEFAPRFDLNGDGYHDLVCASDGGRCVLVYFGASTGFSPDRARQFASPSVGNSDIADLDCDGFADLVHSGYESGHSTIYWGTDSGPSPTDTTCLPNLGAEAAAVADLDRDGYLDLAFAGCAAEWVIVYWGSSSGCAPGCTSLIWIGHPMAHNMTVADLDRDGYQDLVISCFSRPDSQPVVYFQANREHRIEWLEYLHADMAHGTTVADLDKNGWLDIIYTGFQDITKSFVYFGSDSGFRTGNRTILQPGDCYGGSAAFDFNQDSWVDLVYFRGKSAHCPVIYWNSGRPPYFADSLTRSIGTVKFSSSGGTFADFNRDGHVDLFVNSRNTPSMVLWGPDWTARDSLPVNCDHHGTYREPGDMYDRSYREEYVSSVFDAGEEAEWQQFSWQANTPTSTAIALSFRIGNSANPDQRWSDWRTVESGRRLADTLRSRCVQYRASFTYDTPAILPMLERVQVDYSLLIPQLHNFPNPLDNRTTFDITLLKSATVSLRIYDRAGEFISTVLENQAWEAGSHQVDWNATNSHGRLVAPGVYYYALDYHGQGTRRQVKDKLVVSRR